MYNILYRDAIPIDFRFLTKNSSSPRCHFVWWWRIFPCYAKMPIRFFRWVEWFLRQFRSLSLRVCVCACVWAKKTENKRLTDGGSWTDVRGVVNRSGVHQNCKRSRSAWKLPGWGESSLLLLFPHAQFTRAPNWVLKIDPYPWPRLYTYQLQTRPEGRNVISHKPGFFFFFFLLFRHTCIQWLSCWLSDRPVCAYKHFEAKQWHQAATSCNSRKLYHMLARKSRPSLAAWSYRT